jgi:hypothetical protein
MVDTLQEKLRAIVLDAPEECEVIHTLSKTDISQILQAVQDAGWLSPEQRNQVQSLVNQMADTAQQMAKLPVTVREVGTMTGPEWLSRFKAELDNQIKTASDISGTGEDLLRNVVMMQYVMEAARLAAGVSE